MQFSSPRMLCLTLLILALATPSGGDTHSAVEEGYIANWTLCGPFLAAPDMLYTDYLEGVGGEKNARLEEGMKFARADGETVGCQAQEADENGYVDFLKLLNPTGESRATRRRVGYAYTEIESKEAGSVFFAMGGEDQIVIWLNGELVHVSLASRYAKPFQELFPVHLKKGTNRILVKGGRRCCAWKFNLAPYVPTTKLFVNATDLTPAGETWEEQYLFLPDLVVGERIDVLGTINVTNLTSRPLNEIRAAVRENDVLQPAEEVLDSIMPGATRQLPFRLRSRGVIGAADSTDVELVITVEDEVQRFQLEPRLRARGEYFATSYRSELDDSIQPFRIIAPRQYDPERAYALILNMHGYKGDNAYESISSRPWVFVAAANARGEMPYKEAGMWDVLEMMATMKARYNIDEERIYLYGHSMGGRGSWYIGLRKPDLFAAIAPYAGGNNFALPVIENGLNLPTFVVHGAADKVVDVEQSREAVEILEKLDYPVRYHEPPDAGHWWWLDEKRIQACIDDPQLFDFFSRHRLHANPHEVIYQTQALRFNKAYWTSIDQLSRHGEKARLHAKVVPGNEINVKVENISRYTLALNDNLVNMDEPVVITTNGSESYAGPARDAVTIGAVDGIWSAVAAAAAAAHLEKHAMMAGPIFEAFNSRFLIVYGSGGSAEEAEANYKQARWTQVWWQIWANGECRVVPDTSITEADIRERNLILFGNPRSNQVIAQINGQLPIRFDGNAIVAGDQRFSGDDVAVQMIYPNPLNPKRYVLIGGGITPRGTVNIHKTGLDVSSAQFPNSAEYDYVIFDGSFLGKTADRYLKAGHFDGTWQLQN